MSSESWVSRCDAWPSTTRTMQRSARCPRTARDGVGGRRSPDDGAPGAGDAAGAAFAGSVMAAWPPYPGCLDAWRTHGRCTRSVRFDGRPARRAHGGHRPVPRHSVCGAALRRADRFQPPQSPAAWEGERDATSFGATAPQKPYGGGMEKYLSTVEVAGDDILTVNVWTPADRDPAAALPVLVFVHGGALVPRLRRARRVRRRLVRTARNRLRLDPVPDRPGGFRGARRRAAEPGRARPAGGAAVGASRDRRVRRRSLLASR